jgi:hypothetical protein
MTGKKGKQAYGAGQPIEQGDKNKKDERSKVMAAESSSGSYTPGENKEEKRLKAREKSKEK